jgi:Mn2+/Fe2+ NRAMP family transporter
MLTGDRKLMGAFATSAVLRGTLWVVAAVLIVLNVVMLGQAGGLIPGG